MSRQIAVRFVVAPFFPVRVPALGVSTLRAVLERAGIRADIVYCNIDLLRFGKECGAGLRALDRLPYRFLASEMMFARALWKERAPPLEAYLARLGQEQPRWAGVQGGAGSRAGRPAPAGASGPRTRDEVLRGWTWLHENAPEIVRAWAGDILREAPDVVGFTVTSQQNVAALALAQAVRSLRAGKERPAILFGGPNCFGENGKALLDNFPFIDAVVSGEADDVIVDLAREYSARPAGGRVRRFVEGPPVQDLDRLPRPVFEDYFAARSQGPAARDRAIRLAAESSRGCWWGMGTPCSFCARHASTMTYRRKSAQRVAEELVGLTDRYGRRPVLMADNVLDPRLIEPLSRLLEGKQIRMYYEVRADLGRKDLERLKRAGVLVLQPGIESLNTRILRWMRKGTTKLANIAFLKHASELGQAVIWNFLHGVPGETADDYRDTVQTIRSIYHLPPPTGVLAVLMMRFSPLWRSAGQRGLRGVRPHWAYDFVYGALPPGERCRLAFLFEYDRPGAPEPAAHVAETVQEIAVWRRKRRYGASLEIRREGREAWVLDSRTPGPLRVERLGPMEELFLSRVRDVRRLRDVLEEVAQVHPGVRGERPATPEAVLAGFRERRWVAEEKGDILGLVLDPPTQHATTGQPRGPSVDPYGHEAFS